MRAMAERRPWPGGMAILLGLLLALWAACPAPAQDATPSALPTELAGDAAIERLLAVLRDDAARAVLIERLEGLDPAGPAAGAASEAPAPPGLAETLAERTAAAAARTAADLRRAVLEVGRIGPLAGQLRDAVAAQRTEALALLATILSTIAASLALGEWAGRIARRRIGPLTGAGPLRRTSGAAGVILLRLAAVLGAWALGYALAALVFSAGARPSAPQALYLNAFLVFGLVRVGLRAFANPDADREPAFSLLPPATQRAVFAPLRAVGGMVIQGFLFVVPLVHLWAGFAAARPARTAVATLAALVALWAIWAIARALDRSASASPVPAAAPPAEEPAPAGAAPPSAEPAPGLIGPPASTAAAGSIPTSAAAGPAVARGLRSVWRSLWPPLAVIYVVYAWFVAVTRPALVEEIVLGGTILTALAIAMLLAGFGLLRRAPAVAAPLPPGLVAAAPTLAPRMDRVARALVIALGLALAAAALPVAAWGWGWLDARDLLARDWVRLAIWRLVSALVVLLAAAMVWAAVASWIDTRLASDLGVAPARRRTLLSLFRNAFGVAVGAVAVMVALSQIGINIAPLLASAGVVGLAIGFGAQKLVQDIINGIFIQLENAMDVGDVVGVAGVTGGVERLTIRSVRLRTMDGATHIIPFSSVDTVTNLTRDFGYHVAEISVPYDQPVDAVKAAMRDAFEQLRAESDFARDIDGPLDLQGVVALRDTGMQLRARIRTRTGRQWDVGRRYSEILKAVLDSRGIEIAAPSRTIMSAPRTRPAEAAAPAVPPAPPAPEGGRG